MHEVMNTEEDTFISSFYKSPYQYKKKESKADGSEDSN